MMSDCDRRLSYIRMIVRLIINTLQCGLWNDIWNNGYHCGLYKRSLVVMYDYTDNRVGEVYKRLIIMIKRVF